MVAIEMAATRIRKFKIGMFSKDQDERTAKKKRRTINIQLIIIIKINLTEIFLKLLSNLRMVKCIERMD